jgi:hypothetical protein
VALTIQLILQVAYRAYARRHPVAGHVRRVVRDIVACRTGDLGVFIRACPDGHFAEVSGCSCRGRSCPVCAPSRRMRWLAGWSRRLLPGWHVHTIVTLPSQLHPLWRHNRRAMAELLFAVARQTMVAFSADPAYLGALPGMLMALHTWSRSLSLHPHLHVIVTGGGLDGSGHWKSLPREFLAPTPAVRKLFRRLFLEAIKTAWKQGEIALPAGWDGVTMDRELRRLERIKWNVRIEPPYRHGHGVTNYLARYVMGDPIGQSRLVSFDGEEVKFVVGREEKNPATMKLKVEEFIGRWLEHVPERGLHTVRAYGLYASALSEKREGCRAEIVAATVAEASAEPVTKDVVLPTRVERCPVCNHSLVIEEHRQRRPRRWQRPPVRAPERLAFCQAA